MKESERKKGSERKWEEKSERESQRDFLVALVHLRPSAPSYYSTMDVILEGDGDAPTIEDEVSVQSSEVECEHVSGRSHLDFPKINLVF